MIKDEAIRLPFRYAAGRVGSAYLAALRDERRFTATSCPSCARVLSPARSLCPYCGTPAAEATDVGPEGRIESWTDVPRGGRYVLVRLDGADTSVLHRLVGSAPPVIGARVRPAFTDAGLAGFEVIER